MGMFKWFFRDATKFEMAARGQLRKILWSHIPHDMEMCRWLFQGFTGIQNGGGGVKTKKKLFSQFFSNFNIIFLATWGCASDFLKMLPNFKMAARGQLQIFLWAQKL